MAFLWWVAKSSELVIGDSLESMFSHQPQALQLCSNYAFSLGLVVQLECFHSLGIQRVVRHEQLVQISFHDLILSSKRSHTTPRHSGVCLAYYC
ncbi:hypothetical protein O164_14190 [Pseudomonas taiwanensis SJ9]|uniref:Uncharacterized protein n=1 Tax=Pseudomonas taiwanensis SJ9 TaxID=1388762 RepID=V7DBL0_9PSED|nr:hypothetical protein O164_14190 [Pseudomonas taiwanensis SJ9]